MKREHPLVTLEQYVRESAAQVAEANGYYIDIDGRTYFHGDDRLPFFCKECVEQIAETLRRDHHRSKVRIGDCWAGSDNIERCAICGTRLHCGELSAEGADEILDHYWRYYATSSPDDSFGPEEYADVATMLAAYGYGPDFEFCEIGRPRLVTLLFRLAWWMVREQMGCS